MSHARVLIVDDDRDHAESLRDFLAMMGLYGEVAVTGEEAAELYDPERFDLSLIDVRLPGISGIETLSMIRDKNATARAIMMTGFRFEHVLKEATCGRPIFVLKPPFSESQVREKVAEIDSDGLGVILGVGPDREKEIFSWLARVPGMKIINPVLGDDSEMEASRKKTGGNGAIFAISIGRAIFNALADYAQLRRLTGKLGVVLISSLESLEELSDLKKSNVRCLFKPIAPDVLLRGIEESL